MASAKLVGGKTETRKPAADGRRPKVNDPVRFEGEMYVYSGPEEGCPPGWVAFHRPPKLGKGDTKYKRVTCEAKDLTWSPAYQAFYLPGRGVEVQSPTPKGGKKGAARPPLFIEDGLPSDMAEAKIRSYVEG